MLSVEQHASPHLCPTCVPTSFVLTMHCESVWSCNACIVAVKDTNAGAVYLDVNHGQGLLGSAVVSRHSVHGLGNVIQNQVQVYFIFLWKWGQKKWYYRHYRLICAISMSTIYQYVHDKPFPEQRLFSFFLSFALWIHCVGFFPWRQETHQNASSMICAPTAATDNDIISSFPGWTRHASGRACAHLTMQHTDPERLPCLLASPPNYSRTSFDSEQEASPDSSAASRELAVWGLRIALTVGKLTRSLMDSQRKVSGSLSDWTSEAWGDTLVSSRS